MINTILYLLMALQMSVTDEIRQTNKQMEEAFNAGDLKKVASFYADDAVLLNADGKAVTGRKNIDDYWMKVKNPVTWELEVIEVSQDEKHIYENPYYKSLKNKPLDWRVHGFEFDDRENLVYQLGHSTLKTKRDDGVKSSEVDFILIWQATDEGYKILLDTYSW
ncbi:nuclear transport factor 2 family protein [Fulvivirga aurantia]|uniref:nuclear transport factor 2 family protein n=1 Tax=Fulvivirga aurantia TaxID=2529383 RepID=UPI001628E10F|nr:nuclear transport factor 2 family protein [Fulvivirga aurantia]